MAVRCAKCNEELLGSVNRCWKCGTQFAAIGEEPGVPPVRRGPVRLGGAPTIMAEAPGELVASWSEHVVATSPHAVPSAGEAAMRVGSPFAVEPVGGGTAQPSSRSAARIPRYDRNAWSSGAAIASLSLGLMSLLGMAAMVSSRDVNPILTLLVAAMGFVMGIWGLFSRHRSLAIIGVIFCCLGLSFGGFRGTVELYEYVYHENPFERNLDD